MNVSSLFKEPLLVNGVHLKLIPPFLDQIATLALNRFRNILHCLIKVGSCPGPCATPRARRRLRRRCSCRSHAFWTLEYGVSRLRVGIRRAPRAVNMMRDGRVGGRRRGHPRYSYNAGSTGCVEGTEYQTCNWGVGFW
jgi:hypothetical protein